MYVTTVFSVTVGHKQQLHATNVHVFFCTHFFSPLLSGSSGGSDVVSVSCFGVRVSVMFQFMFVQYLLIQFELLSGHLLGRSCPLG